MTTTRKPYNFCLCLVYQIQHLPLLFGSLFTYIVVKMPTGKTTKKPNKKVSQVTGKRTPKTKAMPVENTREETAETAAETRAKEPAKKPLKKRVKKPAENPAKKSDPTPLRTGAECAQSDIHTETPNVFDLTARDFPWPLSLHAIMADHGIIMSGSRALDAFKPGHGSFEGSDIDMYAPRSKAALEAICKAFNCVGAQWDNYIVQKLQELDTREQVMIPGGMLLSLAVILAKNNLSDSDKQLCEYLKDRASRHKVSPSQMSDLFLEEFCCQVKFFHDEVKKLNGKRPTKDEDDDKEHRVRLHVWVFDTGRKTAHMYEVGNQVEELIEWIDSILDEWPLKSGMKFLDRKLAQKDMPRLRKSLMDVGLPIDHLFEYVIYRIIRRKSWISPRKITEVVFRILYPKKVKLQVLYGENFDILNGKLQNNRKIQIIVDLDNLEDPLRTVLRFYATHIMSFIGGTCGAHLYWDSAKHLKSRKFDFSRDPRQKGAEIAIRKWSDRKWTFSDVSKARVTPRNMCKGTKMIDFEPLYAAAFREMHEDQESPKEQKLPKKVTNFFAEQRAFYRSFGWTETYGKIPKKTISSLSHKDCRNKKNTKVLGLADWVRQNLDGHNQVIPRDRETQRDHLFAQLDVFLCNLYSVPRLP